ncbi:hypothetical protein [Bradyrhizobium sp. WD16]|uniref:hypothetical protein n=1 Tax=Bradyrhizobium sp. WD16 TaxID=1521768 RepID=UPI0020A43956|nr:hypothetical protein [Bradyrhizobium sp. WD16]UTD27948.1 hypothetical protein DB459_14545 [Bradyrhizobium sp. WD16]
MIIPFIALAFVVALIPAFGIIDANRAVGVASAVLALALVAVALTLPGTSLTRFTRLLRPVLIIVLVAPALWMLAQVLPMPATALANPIWASASTALNQPIVGAITIDIGATLLSLAQYCAVIAAALVTAAIALDRQRAESILYILLAISALVAARQIAQDLGFDQVRADASGGDGAEATIFAVLGILLSCTSLLHADGRRQRSGRHRKSNRAITLSVVASIVALLACTSELLIHADTGTAIAALLGAGTLCAIFAIRQWLPGPWGRTGLAAAAVIGLFAAFAAIPIKKDMDLAIAWSMPSLTATERMLSDIPLAGSGAGTFEALLPLYRDISALATAEIPTAAATITIEMGRAFLCGLILAALSGALVLFNRSLSRGHDYIYAGAGAGALLALPVTAFLNGGILSLGASLFTAVLCGLAFAQSRGSARHVQNFELREAPIDPGKGRRPLNALDETWPRVALAVFGVALTAQAAWILSAERYSSRGLQLAAAQTPASLSSLRDGINTAASLAIVRGDLWAESAMIEFKTRPTAQLGAPPDEPPAGGPRAAVPAAPLKALNRAVRYAPHRGDAWLMLALLADRYKPVGYDTSALLKMSYYTAPNELSLLPARLRVALGAETAAGDPELQDMIRRDVSLVLTRLPALRPALVAAYQSAAPGRKLIAERLISEVDPSYLKTIRTQYP